MSDKQKLYQVTYKVELAIIADNEQHLREKIREAQIDDEVDITEIVEVGEVEWHNLSNNHLRLV